MGISIVLFDTDIISWLPPLTNEPFSNKQTLDRKFVLEAQHQISAQFSSLKLDQNCKLLLSINWIKSDDINWNGKYFVVLFIMWSNLPTMRTFICMPTSIRQMLCREHSIRDHVLFWWWKIKATATSTLWWVSARIRNSSALPMELRLSCINPSTWQCL